MPDLIMSENNRIADLKLRTKRRFDYPGACSLEHLKFEADYNRDSDQLEYKWKKMFKLNL